MDEQDPKRRNMQPPIPSHLPDTAPPEAEEKIAGASGRKPGDAPSGSPGLASGHAADEGVGGAGLGKAPGDGDAGTRDQDTRAGGAQDKP